MKSLTLWLGVITLVLYVFCYYFVDLTTAQYIHNHLLNTGLQKLASVYSHVLDPKLWALIMVASALGYLISKKTNPQIAGKSLFVALSLFFAIVLGGILKIVLARYRPELYFANGLFGFHFFSLKDSAHSTPSGSVLTTCAGLFAFCKLFPRLKFLFLTLIFLTMLARVITLDHYVSDVIFGAYIGYIAMVWSQLLLTKLKYPLRENGISSANCG